MTELSDYRRLVEKPNQERLDRMIQNQKAEIERLRLLVAGTAHFLTAHGYTVEGDELRRASFTAGQER